MSDSTISRGFLGRKRPAPPANRVPPGQHLVSDFPVLSAGPTPRPNLDTWRFSLQHQGSLLGQWSWQEFQALTQTRIMVDIHCVTTWSKLDTRWEGVTIDTLLAAAGLSAALSRMAERSGPGCGRPSTFPGFPTTRSTLPWGR